MLRCAHDTASGKTPLEAMASHIYNLRCWQCGSDFAQDYSGKFEDMPKHRCRSVLFLNPGSRAEFEKNQVPVRFQSERAFVSRWDTIDGNPAFIDGPTGSGKSCFGLFGLTTCDQLLVRIAAPPPLHTPVGHGLSSRVSACVADAEQHLNNRDGEDATTDPVNAARGCYMYEHAMRYYVLDMLEARIGKRTGVHPAEAVETILFFDDFNALSTRGQIGRQAARGLHDYWASDNWSATKLKESLLTDFGIKLHGIAMVGSGLDIGRPSVITHNLCSNGNYFVPAGLRWSEITDKTSLVVTDHEVVAAHMRADVEALLRLPRLAALVLQYSKFDDVPTLTSLKWCIAMAVHEFVELSPALSDYVDDEAKCRQLAVQSVRLILFPLTRDDSARSLIAERGLAALCCHGFDREFRCFVFPAQRLILRRLFERMSGFRLAVSRFMFFAVAASHGKTVAEFVGALNNFFSHSEQHGEVGKRSVAHPTVKAPQSLEQHVISSATTSTVGLEDRKTVTPSSAALVVLNEFNGDLPWDVQLVLPVSAGTADVEHVTFNLKIFPTFPMSLDHVAWEEMEAKSAAAPAIVRGAQHAGYVAVVARVERKEGCVRERGAPVWHVNADSPNSLGVVPFSPRSFDTKTVFITE